MVFGRRKREELLREIEEELSAALCRKREDISLKFVCNDDIKRIWTRERIEKISKGFKWAVEAQRVQEEFVKVLSTLVRIRWDGWKSFGDLFLNTPNRSDKDLALEDTTFLGRFSDNFFTDQYIFIPVVLEKDNPVSNPGADYPCYSRHHRLPFLSSKVIGRGASATVTKEDFAPGYFKGLEKSGESNFVAVKRFERSQSDLESFKSEYQNIKAFKECLDKNDNIMLSLATFVHGKQFIILSPLADLDLHEFFQGKYMDFSERCQKFTVRALLEEFKDLTKALNFLHNGLQTRDKKIACAHLDLKPDNILVQWHPSLHKPVGRWMIHDFGTSRIKNSSSGILGLAPGDLLAPGDFLRQFSFTAPRRHPGTFQAPEVQSVQDRLVGTESDMWSCGCILAFVLAFATGGPNGIDKLGRSLYRKDSGGMKNDFFYTTQEAGETIIKPSVISFLQQLQTDDAHDGCWVSKTRNLIFNLLKVEAKDRLKAYEVEDELKRICSEDSSHLLRSCPWIPKAGYLISDAENSGEFPHQVDSGPPNSPSTTKDTILSNSNSETSQILSLTDEFSVMKLKTPERTTKTAVCAAGCHIAFLSKKSAIIHSMADQQNWVPKGQKPAALSSTATTIDCPDGEWNYISISGNYVILRSTMQGEDQERIHRYFLDTDCTPPWKDLPWISSNSSITVHSAARTSVHMAVSCLGDVLFMGNEKLYCYSSEYGLKDLAIEGELQTHGAAFSPDGRAIYGWLYDQTRRKNYWYTWETQTCVRRHHNHSQFRPPENPNGRDTLFPLSTYFAAFERPDRIHIVGKNANKFEARESKTKIGSIIAGASYQGSEARDEALILVSSKPSLILLQLYHISDSSHPPHELKTSFDKVKDGIGIIKQDDGSAFVVIAHSDGQLLRRRISINGD